MCDLHLHNNINYHFETKMFMFLEKKKLILSFSHIFCLVLTLGQKFLKKIINDPGKFLFKKNITCTNFNNQNRTPVFT